MFSLIPIAIIGIIQLLGKQLNDSILGFAFEWVDYDKVVFMLFNFRYNSVAFL